MPYLSQPTYPYYILFSHFTFSWKLETSWNFMPTFFEYQSYIVLLTLVNNYYTDSESNYNECQFQLI